MQLINEEPTTLSDFSADIRGATMIEATLALIILVLFVGAVTDFGFALHEYNFLNYVTGKSAREISAKLATSGDCGEIDRYLRGPAYNEIKNAFAVGAGVKWGSCMLAVGGTDCLAPGSTASFRSLRITGNLPINCYFLCTLIPKAWSVTSVVTVAIENAEIPTCPEMPVS